MTEPTESAEPPSSDVDPDEVPPIDSSFLPPGGVDEQETEAAEAVTPAPSTAAAHE